MASMQKTKQMLNANTGIYDFWKKLNAIKHKKMSYYFIKS